MLRHLPEVWEILNHPLVSAQHLGDIIYSVLEVLETQRSFTGPLYCYVNIMLQLPITLLYLPRGVSISKGEVPVET